MVFFILFLWNMLCGVWANQAGDPVVAQQNKQKMHVVIKMFFVMGVSWIAEIILFFVNWLIGDHKIYKGIFLFQLINSLQVNKHLLHEFVMLLSILPIEANQRTMKSTLKSYKLNLAEIATNFHNLNFFQELYQPAQFFSRKVKNRI